MKNNNKGMTVIEVIIAISIFTIVSGIVYSIYISNTKTIAKTELKAMLQNEGQQIQNTISRIGMQSSGIEKISATPINSNDELNGYYSVNTMSLEFKDKDNINYIYKFSILNSNQENNKNKILKLEKLNESNEQILKSWNLSENISEFDIKPVPDIYMDLKDSKSIEILIKLNKSKGFNNVDYDLNTLITFRNKTID